MGKYIIMNAFSGRYLTEESNKNIGHESMNFFMPDGTDGNFLLWFNSSGIISESMKGYDGKICLLMVTNHANEPDKFRVLALARDCKIINGATIPDSENSRKQRFKSFNRQFPDAKYGNTLVKDIFKDNIYQGKPDSENTLATLYTNKNNMFVPRNQTWTIRIKDDPTADIKQNMANEKMRIYVKNDSEFKALINKPNCWIKFDSRSKRLANYPKNSDSYKQPETFFTATRNEKDELSVSNIISYSLINSDELLNALTNELIGIHGYTGADCMIQREDKHVDLTIVLPDRTIIIENKIDSSVVEKGYETRELLLEKTLRPYQYLKPLGERPLRRKAQEIYDAKMNAHNDIVSRINNEINAIPNDDKRLCQLTKYVIQSRIDAYLNKREKAQIDYFFLVPDYAANKFNLDDAGNLADFAYGDKYKLVKYSQLLDIFKKVDNFPYRSDILSEFEILSSKVDDSAQKRQIFNFLKKAGL